MGGMERIMGCWGHDQNRLYEILFKKNAKRTETLLYISEVKKTWRVRQRNVMLKGDGREVFLPSSTVVQRETESPHFRIT